MDPKVTEQLIQEGRLPNFTYLKTIGTYTHLATTIPSETVVAWTSFATGFNPGSHGIFDFIIRNPQNYAPYLTLNEISTLNGKTQIRLRRKGQTFWNILSKNKSPSYIYFCPNTFPPDKLFGKMLSGIGVPTLLIEDNKRKWSGDHLIDSHLVPGVIYVNKKIELSKPQITDIAPTILSLFNINKSQDMQGKILFNDENR